MKEAPFIINGLMMLAFGLIGLLISWIFLLWVAGGIGLVVFKVIWAVRNQDQYSAPK